LRAFVETLPARAAARAGRAPARDRGDRSSHGTPPGAATR